MSSTASPPPYLPEAPERPPGAGRDRGPAAPAWIAPVGVVTALVASLIVGLFVAIAAELGGVDVITADEPPPGVVVAGALIQAVVFVGTAIAFLGIAGGARPERLGLRGTRFWRAVGVMVLFFVGFLLIAALWWALVGIPDNEELLDTLGVDESTLLLVLGALAVCVAAPVGEEVLFRGFFYGVLRGSIGVPAAAVATGIVFGLVHVVSSPVEHLVPLAVFGAGLCLVYQATGSLYPCIALHAINNTVAFGANEEWTWQIAPVVVAAVAVCLGISSLGARAWRRA